jgi:transposase-like protein
LGVIEVLGVERRRRWPDAVKLSILAEVNTVGWSLADVARRHDVTRQHIYQWRRESRAKGLLPGSAVTHQAGRGQNHARQPGLHYAPPDLPRTTSNDGIVAPAKQKNHRRRDMLPDSRPARSLKTAPPA